jgi:hypothetical protein
MDIGHIQMHSIKFPSDYDRVSKVMRRLNLKGYVKKDAATKFIYAARKKYKGIDLFFIPVSVF